MIRGEFGDSFWNIRWKISEKHRNTRIAAFSPKWSLYLFSFLNFTEIFIGILIFTEIIHDMGFKMEFPLVTAFFTEISFFIVFFTEWYLLILIFTEMLFSSIFSRKKINDILNALKLISFKNAIQSI